MDRENGDRIDGDETRQFRQEPSEQNECRQGARQNAWNYWPACDLVAKEITCDAEIESGERPEYAAFVDPFSPWSGSGRCCMEAVCYDQDDDKCEDKLLAPDGQDDRNGKGEIAEHFCGQRPARKVEGQPLTVEGVKQEKLCRDIRQRIAREISVICIAGMNRDRDNHIKRQRGQMERIDAREPPPEKPSDRWKVIDLVEILTCNHKAGDHKEQIHEQIEMQGMREHEAPCGDVPHVIRIMQDNDGAGGDDPQRIQMSRVVV